MGEVVLSGKLAESNVYEMRDAVVNCCSFCLVGYACTPHCSIGQEGTAVHGAGAKWKIAVHGTYAGSDVCGLESLQGGSGIPL